jgi:hypothetical protein
MTLSPEPEEQRVTQKGQKTNNKQVHWKLPEPNSNDAAAKEKAKEQRKQKERKQKVPEAQHWVPKQIPLKDPKNEKKEQEEGRESKSGHVEVPKETKKHVPKENRTQHHGEDREMRTIHRRPHAKRDLTTVRAELKEFTLVSFNVRGLNGEAKQKIVFDLLKHNRP